MFLHEKTKRPIFTADEAGERLKIDPSNIRHWARRGEITQIVDSPRRVYYYVDEVEKRSKEAAANKKRRGGRPRKVDDAA